MKLARLGDALSGYLVIRIQGAMPERFVNLCTMRGIHLWGVKRQEGAILACVNVRDFTALREVRRRSRCRIKVVRRAGAPFRYHALLSRAMLLPGLVLCLTLIWGLTQFVWDVQVIGVEGELKQGIEQKLMQYGGVRGTHKEALDLKAMGEQLRIDFPALRYASLRIEGIRLVAEAHEVYNPPEIIDPNQQAMVIATKNGIIEEVVVLRGTPVVKKGDAVRKGDILISSEVLVDGAPLRRVHAQGRVMARVWIEGTARMDLSVAARVPTGRQTRYDILCAGLNRWGGGPPPDYDDYETEISRTQLGVFPPAWIEHVRYVEYSVDMAALDEEAVRNILAEQALDKAMERVAEAATVVDKRVHFSMIEEGILEALARVEVLEDIAQRVPIGQTP